jgi:hypothetical protein
LSEFKRWKNEDPEAVKTNSKEDGAFANCFGSNRCNSQFKSRQSSQIAAGSVTDEDFMKLSTFWEIYLHCISRTVNCDKVKL